MIYQLRHPVGVLAIAVALLLGLYLHDAVQTLVSQALGDPTARRSHRLTARFKTRFDVYGAVCAVIVGYGWGSPVQMDERWRGRRRKLALAIVSGPLTYLVLAFGFTALLRIDKSGSEQLIRANYLAAYTFAAMFILSIIPTPPLDGARIMFALAPQTIGWQKARYQLIERNIGLGIALAVVFLPLAFRVPSIVGGLTADLLNGLGSLVGLSGLGDAAGIFDVP